jgi:hypothetical protein
MLNNFKEGEKSLREFLTETEIEEIRHKLVTKKTSYDLTYNGNVYFLCRYPKKGKIIYVIAAVENWDDVNMFENMFEFDSFDGLLDNFKANGESLREFIFDAGVEAEEYDELLHEYIYEVQWKKKKKE